MFRDIDLHRLRHTLPIIRRVKYRITSKRERKKVQRKIHQLIHEHQIPHTHGEIDRAIGNAMVHGVCPVKCRVYVTQDRHFLCVVQDSGNGFDYQETIRKFQRKEIYYHHHGYGTRCYASNPYLQVDWKNQGTTIVLYYFR